MADAAQIDAPVDAAQFASGTYGFEEQVNPGPTIPYMFANGALMTLPNPNPGGSSGVILVDCNGNDGAFGFGCTDSMQFIPEGKKFFAYSSISPTEVLEFQFPAALSAFSLAISNTNVSENTTYVVTGFNSANAVVATANINSTTFANWINNRVNLANVNGFNRVQIKKSVIANGVIAIDDMRWTVMP